MEINNSILTIIPYIFQVNESQSYFLLFLIRSNHESFKQILLEIIVFLCIPWIHECFIKIHLLDLIEILTSIIFIKR